MELYMKNFGSVWFGVACKGKMVVATSFSESKARVADNIKQTTQVNFPIQVSSTFSDFAKRVFEAMKEIYTGNTLTVDVPLSMERLPAYTQRVLKTVSKIPTGYVTSYGAVAEAAGGGPRAVGNAMANNPFAPIVPCHRVVTSNLGLGGYGGGLRVKYEFLKREQRGYTESRNIPLENENLKVFPVEFVIQKLERKKLSAFYIKQDVNS